MVIKNKALTLRLYEFLIRRKDFILFCLLKLITVVLNFTTNIIIVRRVSVEEFGTYSTVLMVVGFAVTFGFSWSSSSLVYYGSREKAVSGNLNKTFWARNIILSISLFIVTCLLGLFHRQINEYIGINITLLILIWIYIRTIEDYLTQYFLTIKKQAVSNFMIITKRIILLALVFIYQLNVKNLITISIISDLTIVLYLIFIDRSDLGKFEFDLEQFKEVLSFSLWQVFGYSGLYFINFGDIIVIKHFMSVQDIGVYNAAYKLFSGVAEMAFMISSFYAAGISASIHKGEIKKVKDFYYGERPVIFCISLISHGLLILISRPIITMVYGERYLGCLPVLNILLIGSALRYLSVFYMIYYNTNKKYAVQQTINIVRAVLNFLLDIILIRYFGILGPAIATTTAIFLAFAFSFFYCEIRIKRSCSGISLDKVTTSRGHALEVLK